MTQRTAVILFVSLAALYGAIFLQSIVGAAASALVALAMWLSDQFPVNDGHPTRAQNVLAFTLIIVMLASYIVQTHDHWTNWFATVMGSAGLSMMTLVAIYWWRSGRDK